MSRPPTCMAASLISVRMCVCERVNVTGAVKRFERSVDWKMSIHHSTPPPRTFPCGIIVVPNKNRSPPVFLSALSIDTGCTGQKQQSLCLLLVYNRVIEKICFHFIFSGDFVPCGHQYCMVTAKFIVNRFMLHHAINHSLYIISLKKKSCLLAV